jgi:FeS assembly SUF system protein
MIKKLLSKIPVLNKDKEKNMEYENENQSLFDNSDKNEKAEKPEVIEKNEKQNHSVEDIRNEAIKVLKTIYDPEIPVNIHDLGLIYDIMVAENGDVLVVMTLTSPACPVAGSLPGEVEQKLREHPMINEAKVELTFDPPWDKSMMTEEAMFELGFL